MYIIEELIDRSGFRNRKIYILKLFLRIFHELMNLSSDSDLT